MKNILLCCVLFVFYACNDKSDYNEIFSNPKLYNETVHELNLIVMGNNFSPIVASRNYTYACIGAYEVMAAINPTKFNSLAGQLNGLNNIPKPSKAEAINFPFATLLTFCNLGESVTFPEGSMKYYVDSLKHLATTHGMPSDILTNSIKYADTVSQFIKEWSSKDNYAQTRTYPKYQVQSDIPWRWVPTPPGYFEAAEPNWRYIRTMVLDSANQFIPPPPPEFDIKNKNSKYYKELMLIKTAVDSLNKEQKHIADFWDDNPMKLNVVGHLMFNTKKFSPPGHWMGIAGIAASKAKLDFENTVYAYALLSIVQFDAFIHCWDEKYRSNYARPETVINQFFDQEWRPYLQTPPFPEYTCGHSTVSAANAEALTAVFGDNFAYTDSTELEFGIANRSFTSFRNAAIENNWARFYGGIHFHNSCIVSTEYGRKVGDYVVSHLSMKK